MMNTSEAVSVLRERLLATVVATTGVTTLGSNLNGFVRLDGSFLADGFRVGMEVQPSGFVDNEPTVIEWLDDTTMVVSTELTAEVAAAGRSLTVGIPSIRSWDNIEVDLVEGLWHVEEDFIPGPKSKATLSMRGQIHHQPMYVLRLYGIAGTGVDALYRVGDAILSQFAPGSALPMSDGSALRVSTEMAPFYGQITYYENQPVLTITIPLWKRTHNPI